MGEPQNKRAVWVDAARCLAMVSIIWMHSGESPTWLIEPVGGSICLFFVLAGRFMPSAPGQLAARTLRLALAWLLWSLISWGLFILAQPEEPWSLARAFGIGEAAYNTPLWFLKDLCIFQLLMAGLMWLRVLPRYKWLLLVLLAGFAYAAEPAQHVGLRFDWMPALLLGYCLQGISPGQLRERISSHAPALVVAGVVLLLQQEYYPALLQHFGIRSYTCSLPLASLAYALGYLLLGMAAENLLPKLAGGMARCGSCMLFIYAGHSLAYAPFYPFPLPLFVRLALMLLVMIALTCLCIALQKLCPRVARLLTAK